jgi:hypothetical protein
MDVFDIARHVRTGSAARTSERGPTGVVDMPLVCPAGGTG